MTETTVKGAVKGAILEAVEAGFEAQVAFLGALVRIPSLRCAEAPAQDFMAQAYRTRGYGVDRWKIALSDIAHLEGFSPALVSYDNAWNVVASNRTTCFVVPQATAPGFIKIAGTLAFLYVE